MPIITRVRNLLNAFALSDETRSSYSQSIGQSTSSSPQRTSLRFYNDRSMVTSIYTRIAIDVAGVDIRHIKLDELERYSDKVDSGLNTCLNLEANIDQAPRAFRQDMCMTLFDKGVIAVVPVDTAVDSSYTNGFDILTMRVGEITAWYPKHVKVNLYNEATGMREEITLEKRHVAIIENPLYAVMNEPNSTLQRLIRKLYLLDAVDEASSSGKLDLIIQLPYVIKSEARQLQAEKRRKDIEFQLKESRYGIAYTDGTEKITQLNRPTENSLMKQIEYLVNLLYSQLGITEAVMNGTADEATMINYYNRTVEPILDAFVQSFQRAFIGPSGTTDLERVQYFRNPFKLIPVSQLAEIADKFTRNEILSSNEIRSFMGIPPSKDPKADQLVNSNMPQPDPGQVSAPPPPVPAGPSVEEMDKVMQDILGGLSKDLDSIGSANG